MVVWLKPCESRSSPGFTPKTPLLAQRGFSLGVVIQVVPAAGRQPDGVTSPGRSTRCVDILRGQPQRQPGLAAAGGRSDSARGCDCRPAAGTTGRSTPCVDAAPPGLAAPHGRSGSGLFLTHRAKAGKKTAPCGRRPDQDRIAGRIRRPAGPYTVPAGGTPIPPRSAYPPAIAARVRPRWLPPQARHSAAWPGPSAPRSG